MDFRDWLVKGFLAGLVAGLAMNAFSLTSYSLGITELRYLDWAALIIYGQYAQNLIEMIFALFAHIIFVGTLGIIFAYLITRIGSLNLLFKGLVYGAITWFLLYGVSSVFNLKGVIPLRIDTVASDLVGASIYGLVLAYTLGWLEEKAKRISDR